MKLSRLLLAVAAFSLLSSFVAEARAEGFHGRTGMPWFGYGYSGSLYGLGRLPVPPYYAIHPPVYYSLPQARPYGLSPFAYSGDYQPQVRARRVILNPHIESVPLPEPVEAPEAATTSTARVIPNPYYSSDHRAESSLASQVE